ncbi:MAG: hypothetical protein K6E78_09515, partial [Treponema sp.]|nr:hypothetical protein [Treponema sp.]
SKAFYRENDGDDDNGNEWYETLDLTGLIYIAEDNFKPGVTELTLSDENNWYKLSATDTNKNNVSTWLSEKPETIIPATGNDSIEKITVTETAVEGVTVTKTVTDNIKDIFASTDTTNKYMLYHLITD